MREGRELDALVAEKVMGREVTANVCGVDYRKGSGWHDDYGFTKSRHARNPPYNHGESLPESNANYERVPFYSTDIAAAWKVVEKLKADGHEVVIECDDESWYVTLSKDHSLLGNFANPTITEAICVAALAAVDA